MHNIYPWVIVQELTLTKGYYILQVENGIYWEKLARETGVMEKDPNNQGWTR